VTLVGATRLSSQYQTENVHGNFVVNFGGIAYSQEQKVTDAGEVSVSGCGSSVSGQAAHIIVKKIPNGLC
jgi:hypothetical protein